MKGRANKLVELIPIKKGVSIHLITMLYLSIEGKLISLILGRKYLMIFGLNNISFIQNSPTKNVHATFIEDLNGSILLIEFISSDL